MVKDYFKSLHKTYKNILEMFSRIYELQIADTPRNHEGMKQAYIAQQENRYESAQRLFAVIKFSEVDSIYKLAYKLTVDEHLISLFSSMNEVSK
jgi:hypothetical protein